MIRPLTAALVLVLLVPAVAAGSFRTVLADYRGDGRIDPCAHSPEALRAAQRSIPADIEQYAPDFPSALAAAIEARARGVCDARPPAAAAETVAAAPAAPAAQPPRRRAPAPAAHEDPPAPVAAATPAAAAAPGPVLPAGDPGARVPAPLLLLGMLLGLGVVGAATAGAVRWLGYEPGPLGHAWSEAAWRAGGVWSDFTDWLKFAR